MSFRSLWLPAALAALFLAAIVFRPLLPIDETRYMSVAWEMRLHDGWLDPLTMNFEPYHHKPPLLFWLINLSWGVFGVSRWAGLIPVVVFAGIAAALTGLLGKTLFPQILHDRKRTMLLMAGSVPFIIYSTLILFDLTLTVFVLAALILMLRFSRDGLWRWPLLAGLCLGFGVLTKGPVAFLYVLFLLLLAPLWKRENLKKWRWYRALAAMVGMSVLPILPWLWSVLSQSDSHFAFWLLWEQTAGRVAGNFKDAHLRPFYFYLPLVPVMAMPWIFFPALWRSRPVFHDLRNDEGFRFLLCWLVPTFISFCLISGKQPHYLVPLLPGLVICLALALQKVETKRLAATLAICILLAVAGQAVASRTVFRSYDLTPLAKLVATHPDAEWAYVSNYHGELGFLARLTRRVDDVERPGLEAWFERHPQGYAIIRYRQLESVAAYKQLIDIPYRGKRMGVFQKNQDQVLPQ